MPKGIFRSSERTDEIDKPSIDGNLWTLNKIMRPVHIIRQLCEALFIKDVCGFYKGPIKNWKTVLQHSPCARHNFFVFLINYFRIPKSVIYRFE